MRTDIKQKDQKELDLPGWEPDSTVHRSHQPGISQGRKASVSLCLKIPILTGFARILARCALLQPGTTFSVQVEATVSHSGGNGFLVHKRLFSTFTFEVLDRAL